MRHLYTICMLACCILTIRPVDALSCTPTVSAAFFNADKSVTASSTKDLSNVVLEFDDGTHQKFDGLSGYSQTFTGTGINLDKCIMGVWIKSGCNSSDDGPGYGERVDNSLWDGVCNDPVLPPAQEAVQVHQSTVTGGEIFGDRDDPEAFRSSGSAERNCLSVVSAEFFFYDKHVTVHSTKDLSNVVLEFDDGIHQKFDNLTGYTETFWGTGDNFTKCIAGVWIKSGCNNSGDGPGYGERIDNPEWDGVCNDPVLPPAPESVQEQESTVDGTVVFDDREDLGSLRVEMQTTQIKATPNPVASHGTVYFTGAAANDFKLNISTIDGRDVARNVRITNQVFDLAWMHLKPGLYFFTMQYGDQFVTQKLLVH